MKRRVPEPLETRVALFLDDQEIAIVINALKIAAGVARYEGDDFRARMTEVVEMKVIGAKVRNQDRNIEILEQKYGLI